MSRLLRGCERMGSTGGWITAVRSPKLTTLGQSCTDGSGSENLKNAQEKLEECKSNLSRYTSELETLEGKLKGLKYFISCLMR